MCVDKDTRYILSVNDTHHKSELVDLADNMFCLIDNICTYIYFISIDSGVSGLTLRRAIELSLIWATTPPIHCNEYRRF